MGHRRRRQPVGHVPGPPRHMLETQLAAARRAGGGASPCSRRPTSSWCGPTGLRRRDGRQAGRGQAPGRDRPQDPQGAGPRLSRPPTAAPADRRRSGPGPAVRARPAQLGMPVAIHIGDPKAFWKPATPENERWDELRAHPEWSFYGPGVPSWQELYDAFERRVARHPKTTFIGVHFGNDPEDPDNVARMLDKLPQPLHRHRRARPRDRPPPAEKMRALLRQVPGPHPVRHRHRHRRRPRRT